MPDEGYIEQLGYETVRKSINPPWQSSIRPLSEEAYCYIMDRAGLGDEASEGNKKLKKAIQDYFINKDTAALSEIERLAKHLSDIYNK